MQFAYAGAQRSRRGSLATIGRSMRTSPTLSALGIWDEQTY
jgi:hypothetical protein